MIQNWCQKCGGEDFMKEKKNSFVWKKVLWKNLKDVHSEWSMEVSLNSILLKRWKIWKNSVCVWKRCKKSFIRKWRLDWRTVFIIFKSLWWFCLWRVELVIIFIWRQWKCSENDDERNRWWKVWTPEDSCVLWWWMVVGDLMKSKMMEGLCVIPSLENEMMMWSLDLNKLKSVVMIVKLDEVEDIRVCSWDDWSLKDLLPGLDRKLWNCL